MIPLTVADIGVPAVICRVGGSPSLRRHLETLGFVTGAPVTVISSLGGNLIVGIKESRVALSHETAQKIMV